MNADRIDELIKALRQGETELAGLRDAAASAQARVDEKLKDLGRLKREMHAARPLTVSGDVVFAIWACATAGIAGRMWWDLAAEVLS